MKLNLGCGLDCGLDGMISLDDGSDWKGDFGKMVDDLKVEGCDLTKLVIADARHLPFKGKAFSEIKSCRFVGRGYLVDWKELARVLEDRGLVEALCAYDDTIFHVDFLFDLLEHFPSFKVSVSSLPSRKDYGDSEPIQFDVVYYKRR